MTQSLQAIERKTELDEDGLAWLALVLTPGMGVRRVLEAMRALERPARLFGLALTELEALRMPGGAAQWVFEGRARAAAEEEWAKASRLGVAIVSYDDEAYPERLKEIYDPPPVLWVRGDVGLLGRTSIAVVGTRRPTPYGSGMAERLSRDLAARGVLIVSGMARGVDTAAHKGALQAGRPTVAVWGTGADVVYPKENVRLAEQILEAGGAVVSELPLGTFPAPQNFPRRNRILSGLSLGVLVVEASENSGTRVTARCAVEQGRDVYAVPGNVTNAGSWTPNTLIKQGAQLTATWEDVWEALPSQVKLELEGAVESKAEMGASLLPELMGDSGSRSGARFGAGSEDGGSLRGREAVVFGVLRQDEALQMDEILEKLEAQLSSAEVFTALFELELAGRIRSLPGKKYVRVM
ncbi:MAG TPA: DNA-processing protein DprA [Acidobacteriaceae bacterium]|nr:DNA-processing protein DprA [Acidobacteriaceae bacterium]